MGRLIAGENFVRFRDNLYQPVYLCPCDDVNAGECLVSQLKYKEENLLNQPVMPIAKRPCKEVASKIVRQFSQLI
jgi:hypothetical protein